MTVRTRIAPSPTGMLHLGTARTALFCWAFARHHGGEFILRIEDTDLERSTEEAVAAIIDSMGWLELDYDEGPIRQTERLDRYREVIDRLIAQGKAYPCYASKEELDQLREAQMARGEKPRYDGRWRPENARGRQPPAGVAPVIRFRNPDAGTVIWNDLVKGQISIANTELDDLVIARADLVPTYNFAVVVDDIDMAITHVLRGDDHVNNTPRQINIYRAILGDDGPLPQFGHLPMILGPDGQKLSKRHGAVSVLQYQEDGFLPEALFNYLARLGWSHGDDEKFSREKTVQWFDLAHVNRAPAQYNIDKLLWLNGEYLKEADDARLAQLVAPRVEQRGGHIAGTPLIAAVGLLKQRAKTLNELADEAMLFYGPHVADQALLAQHLVGRSLEAVRAFLDRAPAIAWERTQINGLLKQLLAEQAIKMQQLAVPLRVAVTGRTQTPSVDAVLELLGRDAVLARLRVSLAKVGV
ncbi:MAG TPA: glutamate--tRNA ligase [Burkholderiaceae bacterium]|nr:glutamate--tRNA ligase [Burkholderiaceae bacterium]